MIKVILFMIIFYLHYSKA